eukprot:NODE_5330_length_715_cov_1.819820_g4484_i0.p1 GENE.NODE_5330_length_715_cov_1.819820_g4484_i0~~NODE_5330_length_715_cov_1.819820_g4484_i0.p1  ORF type:complete len:167 (-),score=19.23 NODE_5330_length_715_cov_1.819820_g4484_i0:157-657(-)
MWAESSKKMRPDVLWAQPQANQSPGQPPKYGQPLQQAKGPRQSQWSGVLNRQFSQHSTNDAVLRQELDLLCHPGRKLASSLHGGQHRLGDRRLQQGINEQIGSRYRILDRQVDAYAPDRRHRMGCIAAAKKSRPLPARKPIHLHTQQADITPVRNGCKLLRIKKWC